MALCKFSNIFGKPNEGAHSYSLFNIAIVDVLATALLAYAISSRANFDFAFMIIFIILLIVAYFMHELFCVKTRGNIYVNSLKSKI